MFREIKNAVRTAQATVALTKQYLDFVVLEEVIKTVLDFGDIEATCECQKKTKGYFALANRGNKLRDLKALYGQIP